MKRIKDSPLRTRPKPILSVHGLVLAYIVLCLSAVYLSRIFVSQILLEGNAPPAFSLVIFFTIPFILLVFFAVSSFKIVYELAKRHTGSKFQVLLLGYFFLTVLFCAAPVTIITFQAIDELLRFWKSTDIDGVIAHSQQLSLDVYTLHVERLERLAKEEDFSTLMDRHGFYEETANGTLLRLPPLPPDRADSEAKVLPESFLPALIIAVEDFTLQSGGTWACTRWIGEDTRRFKTTLEGLLAGVLLRELPRDADTIRFLLYKGNRRAQIISYDLGAGFDAGNQTVQTERERFASISSIKIHLTPILIIYFGVFFLPILLITMIMTISFSQALTAPIVEIAEATKKVAEGNFGVQIFSHRNDELGLLIRSFNTMVLELEKSHTRTLKAEKISIWQDMAQQLAHEIKNPLTPIRLSAERVLRRWRNEPHNAGDIIEGCMLSIIQEVEGLSSLLNEFKTLSRPLEPSQSWTAVRPLVEELIEPYKTSYPLMQFNIDYLDAGIQLKIERNRLAQVLTNIIINGIDAMNSNGCIEIRSDLVKKRELRYCRLSIHDTGQGISEEVAKQVFTPYFTTKETGTGLGLPIVERIVNEHGGSIFFNSEPGVGSVFYIDLPIVELRA